MEDMKVTTVEVEFVRYNSGGIPTRTWWDLNELTASERAGIPIDQNGDDLLPTGRIRVVNERGVELVFTTKTEPEDPTKTIQDQANAAGP